MREKKPLFHRFKKWLARGVEKRKRYEMENHLAVSMDSLRYEGFTSDEIKKLKEHYFEHPDELIKFPIFETLVGEEKEAAILRFRELLEEMHSSE